MVPVEEINGWFKKFVEGKFQDVDNRFEKNEDEHHDINVKLDKLIVNTAMLTTKFESHAKQTNGKDIGAIQKAAAAPPSGNVPGVMKHLRMLRTK